MALTISMVWILTKGVNVDVARHFSSFEFDCHCNRKTCTKTLIHPEVVTSLKTLRKLYTQPIRITSGYRCDEHNQEVGGRKDSYHNRGMAVDIVPHDVDDLKNLLALARVSGFDDCIVYPEEGFIHCEVERVLQ